MFSGSFDRLTLAEVLRLLVNSSQSGALIIQDQGWSGAVHLAMGQFVHAEIGSQTGLDALQNLVQRTHASFAFDPELRPPFPSLACYPTEKILRVIEEEITALRAVEDAMPAAEEVVRYLPDRLGPGVQADSRELALLLLADGTRNVQEIASEIGFDLPRVRRIFGKFRYLGLLETVQNISVPPPVIEQLPAPKPPMAPRFWRGRRIE